MEKYILLDPIRANKVYARFSTLEKAHKERLAHMLLHPNDNAMLFNGETNKFLEWRKDDLNLLEKYKYKPEEYLDKYYFKNKKVSLKPGDQVLYKGNKGKIEKIKDGKAVVIFVNGEYNAHSLKELKKVK